ncbi:MAG TPA: hypothetical protein VHE37_16770 [Nevskiaceae bacterium]|nr:hypothetical protein [Nevskiaceae bacterium]
MNPGGSTATDGRARAQHRRFPRLRARFEKRYARERDARFIEMDIARFPYMGFGATIGWIHAVYVACDMLGARLLVLNPSRWPFGGNTADGAIDRFLEFPEADLRQASTPGALPYQIGSWDNLRCWGYYDPLDLPTCTFGYRPPRFATLDDYRRDLMRRMYRPTAFVRGELDRALDFCPSRYIAWHARRGDKTSGVWKEDEAVPLSRYCEETRAILQRDPAAPRVVVLCSDSPLVLDEARDEARRMGLEVEFIADPAEKRWDGYCALQRTGKITSTAEVVAEVLTAQKNIEVMRAAEYLLGCNSSCLFRVAALLRADGDTVTSFSENKVYKKYYPI